MRGPRAVVVLTVLVVVLAGLLVAQRPWRPVLLSFTAGTPTCHYDLDDHEVAVDVPLTIATRGRLEVEVRAELFDRRDPERRRPGQGF